MTDEEKALQEKQAAEEAERKTKAEQAEKEARLAAEEAERKRQEAEDAKAVNMTTKQLSERIERGQRVDRERLLSRYGVKTEDELDTIIAEHKKQKEASMTELDKIKADRDRLAAENAAYQEEVETQQFISMVTHAASKKGVKPHLVNTVGLQVAQDLSTLSDDEISRMTEEDIETRIEGYKKTIPEFFGTGTQQTIPSRTEQTPPPPPEEFNAMTATKEQMEAYAASHNLPPPGSA